MLHELLPGKCEILSLALAVTMLILHLKLSFDSLHKHMVKTNSELPNEKNLEILMALFQCNDNLPFGFVMPFPHRFA